MKRKKPNGKAVERAYTPLERLLLAAAPFHSVVEDVLTQAKQGQASPLGIFVQKKSTIITANPEPELQLIGVQIPLDMARALSAAFIVAQGTPLGQRLHAKVMQSMDDRMAEQAAAAGAPPEAAEASGEPS